MIMGTNIKKTCSFPVLNGKTTKTFYLIEETGLRLIRRKYRIESSTGGSSTIFSFSNDYDEITKDWTFIEEQSKLHIKAFKGWDENKQLFKSYNCLIRGYSFFMGSFNDCQYYFLLDENTNYLTIDDIKKGKYLDSYPPLWINSVKIVKRESAFRITINSNKKNAEVTFKMRGQSEILVDTIDDFQEFESCICRSIIDHDSKQQNRIAYIWDQDERYLYE